MSSNFTQAQTASVQSAGGIQGLEQRLVEAHKTIDALFDIAWQTRDRLYPSRPAPVQSGDAGNVPATLEGGLNLLLKRLDELRQVTAGILHG